MCDRCRWNDHDGCQGWLAQGQRLRCLCRTCLDQRLARAGDLPDVPAVPAVTAVPAVPAVPAVTDVTERALRPARPRLVLIRGEG